NAGATEKTIHKSEDKADDHIEKHKDPIFFASCTTIKYGILNTSRYQFISFSLPRCLVCQAFSGDFSMPDK
ncbi:MAG: hypothetical protein PHI56_00580, partial [Victivallaceae bacterium]|nr:hypothetical protein [Victivallaceae bacterium]